MAPRSTHPLNAQSFAPSQDPRLLQSQDAERQHNVDNNQDPLPLQNEPAGALTSAEISLLSRYFNRMAGAALSQPTSPGVDTCTAPAFRASPHALPDHSPVLHPSPEQAYLASFHPFPSPIYANGGPDETAQDTTPPSSYSKSPFSSMPTSSSSNTMSPSSPRKFTRSAASAQSSRSSSSSNPSINSVGFIDQLDKFRCEIEPHREMLTASHKCTSCHVSLMDPCRLPVSAPAPYMAEAQAEPKILGYVLVTCAVCLRAYCEGCGKEIKEPGQGTPWFAAAVSCCETVVARGLLNVLSDLDVQVEHAPGGIPSSAGDLLDVIINHFLFARDTRESTLLMQVARASKLFKLIDDVVADIQLANLIEVDSAKWKIYLQTGRLLRGFMIHREYRRYIVVYPYCNVPILRHQEGARAWIKGGCELEGSDVRDRAVQVSGAREDRGEVEERRDWEHSWGGYDYYDAVLRFGIAGCTSASEPSSSAGQGPEAKRMGLVKSALRVDICSRNLTYV
ncbi:hypothetical protein EV421DRAFT_1740427 [Armillaria borealis]|uniref:Uncharacterized protein n=1 Tax=Armillaria borealis TaxID=47425 RepID=A0AA39J5G6_9AGAR|nr:hypothetical protein EV421DRAFT_1740427 [Armillaria borealis]